MSSESKARLYGIGAVARITGLSDHTIRVWERRYGAVVAQRADNGRRVYTPADVEKLDLLGKLTGHGLAIGQIADDSIDKLRERLRDIGEIGSTPVPQCINVAILGQFLPSLFDANKDDIAPLRVRVTSQDRDRFLADIRQQEVDIVVLECPVFDAEVSARVLACMNEAGAARGMVVYRFGRDRDIQAARRSGIVVMTAPATVDEVRAAIIRAYNPPPEMLPAGATEPSVPDLDLSEPIPPRRFSSGQLATLARASTAIDCECPHHLAQLVADLTAFEIYSAQCENRGDDDAALHRYLHHVTAQARARIEEALERVAAAEGIDY